MMNCNRTIANTIIATGMIMTMIGASSAHVALAADSAANANNARLRVVHASPNAPAVDVYVDGSRAASNAPFKGITAYIEAPAGSYLFQFVPTGNSLSQGPLIVSTTVTLNANKDYTLVALGELGNIEPIIIADDNTLPPAGEAWVRFVHASPDAPSLDVVIPTVNKKLFSNIAFKGIGAYTPLAAGIYDVSMKEAGTDTTVVNVENLTIEPQTVYTVYVFGLANGTPALSADVTVDAAKTAAMPITGGEGLPITIDGVTLIALGVLLMVVGFALRRKPAQG